MNRNEKWSRLKSHNPGLMVDYLAVPQADAALKSYYGVQTETELLDILGSDFYYYSVRDISQNEGFMKCYKNKLLVTDSRRVCPLGIVFNRGAYDSKFAVDEAIEAPMKHVETPEDVLSFPFPKAADFDFECLLGEQTGDRIRIGGLWTGIMGDSYRMYGFERFLTDIALKPDVVHTLIDRLTEMYLELNEAYFTALKGKLDIWFFGNDFGSQMGLLMSESMWYEFFFDNIVKLCRQARSYGLTVMMHSCGGIKQIIPYLIEAGVEILDPIQVTAKDMEPQGLVNQFRDKIIFHGGLDTQNVLPFGTPKDVTDESIRLLNVFNEASYIFAPSQVLNKDVPYENIVAMYNTLKERS